MALYHTAKGTETYTIVGNPTIVGGVASGFSDSNHIKINNSIGANYSSFEFVSKIRLDSFGQSFQTILNATGYQFFICVSADKKITLYATSVGSSTSWNIANNVKGTTVLQLDTNYWVKFAFNGNSYIVSISTNGTSYTTEITINNSAKIEISALVFGKRTTTTGRYLLGSIDLNHTYIKVDGQPWFGVCPIEVKKHQIMGPVGYEVVSGTPTITDGILTGVNSSTQVSTTQALPSFDTLEVFAKVSTKWLSSGSYIPTLGFGNTSSRKYIHISNSNKQCLFRLTADTSNDIIVTNISYPTSSSQFVFVKIQVTKKENSYEYILSYSSDNTNWTSATGTRNISIAGEIIWLLRTFAGAAGGDTIMDLNHTYIKVNGKLWFYQPQETKKIIVNGVEVWSKPS